MSEKRSVYRKSESGDDSDDENHDNENNASNNSGSGNSSGSDSEDGTASDSSVNSSAHGRSSRASNKQHSSDASDDDHHNRKNEHSRHTKRISISKTVTGSPNKIEDETQHSNNSRTNGISEDDNDNNNNNSDSESNNSDSSSSGSDSNDEEQESADNDEETAHDKQQNLNVSHNTSGVSVTSSSSATTATTNTTTISNTSNAANDNHNNAECSDTNTNNRSDADDASNNDSNDDDDDEDMDKSNSNAKVSSTKLSAIAKTARRQRIISDEDDEKMSDKDSDAESNKSSADENEAGENDDDDDDDDEPVSPTESSSSSSEDDEDDYQPKRSTRQARKPTSNQEKDKKNLKKKRTQNWDSDESNESDGDDDSDESTSRRRKIPAASSKSRQKQQSRGGSRKKRANDSDESDDDSKRTATRRNAAAVSYKEASDVEKTDSEDLLDYEYDESQAEAAAAALEEEDKSETIERVLAQRVGKKGCTGNQTTIYALEENEEENKKTMVTSTSTTSNTETTPTTATTDEQHQQQNSNSENIENTEVQYLIKWKGWSYIHNTWESETTLREQKAKGMKKLENFIKKEQDIEYWRRYAGPEDIDYFECQLELQNDLLKSYNNVDRIIARNEKEDGTCEYLCKWQSLPYAESTWEDATLVLQKWKQCVEHFDDREMSKCTPSRQCKVLRHRPKFYRIKDQPDFIPDSSLILRDYQLDGLNWLLHSWCKENSVILADEMGLGKTIQTICFLYSLFKLHNLYGPFLCVVPLSTMTAWQREFQLWAPEMNVVTYLGDVKSREMIRQYEWQFDGSKRLKFNCILTTYEIVLKDKFTLGTLQWAALLVDEAHRLKNDDSLLYKSLKEFETNHRLLITGTPLQNSLKELWALLHFIMPEKFLTWEDFELEHGNAADKGYTRLHQQLEPFILRRVKKDVEKSLPAKVEQILRVEMTSVQKQYYKWILTKNFDALRKGKRGSTSTFLNIVIELKKCCNHAALIRPSEFELMGMAQEEALQTLLKGSGKLVLLDKLLCRLHDTGHRVLIFSQMVRMLDVLSDYLQKRHFPFQRLDGSIKGEMRRQALDHFNAEGSQDFCFLLSTRAGGLGINLATADTVIIFDSDWNPQNDLQAQARAHRIGQKNQVNIYRLVTARSVEEQIVERAKQKMVLDHLVIQRMDTTGRTVLDKSGGGSSTNSNPFDKDDLSAILKFGAEELFKDEQENDDELVCDIDEILRRAETRNEDPEMPGDDLLSAFKVASIVAFEEEPDAGASKNNHSPDENDMEDDTKDWDEIIPENFRKIVEEKERAKEMEDLYLPPRRKTTTSGQPDSTPTKRGKKGQQQDDSGGDSDYEAGSDASGGEGDGRKRRGRATKEKINGFTDAELRRFIRSYKKFPAPMLRLEAIACDAELQEKPLAELKRIGQMLHDRCVQFLEEHKEETTTTTTAQAPPTTSTATAAASKTTANGGASEETAATKQKRNRATYSIKLGGVSFNAKTLLTSEEELKPLNEIIPSLANERLAWTFDLKTRPANFDTEWGSEEDSKLLCGIYQYGIGSWEQMKLDPSLKLTDKILFNDVRKPQAKHLQSRAEYLLKIIKKNLELKKKGPKKGRQRKPRKTKETKSNNNNNEANNNATPESRSRRVSETHGAGVGGDASQNAATAKSENENDLSNDADAATAAGKTSNKKKRKSNAAGGKTAAKGAKKGNAAAAASAAAKGKKANKPMHFTANNEPRALEELGDLDPTIFNECKEKMRPVKRALKALDRPDSSLTDQEQVKHTRDCLLAIGKQIDACLEAYNEADKKVWRSNLWYFVSKFTEHDAKKLFKIYKSLKETTKLKTNKNDAHQTTPSAATSSPTKSNSQSPVKKSKESKKSKKKESAPPPNGIVGGDNKEKNKNKNEKNVKKKKKDKDRDRDAERNKLSTSNHPMGDRFTAKGAGAGGGPDHADKSQRFNAAQPHKRKHDAGGGGGDLNDSKSFKRNFDNRTAHDRNDERKKHRDEYYGGGNSHEGGRSEWRDALNSPSSINNRNMSDRSRLSGGASGGGGNYRDRTTSGGDNRSPFVDSGNERWSGHGRDRYGNSDYKRDRYDSYNNRSGGGSGGSGGGYHNRGGNRDNRRPEKRRYPQNLPPHSLNYPGHYPPPQMAGNYFMGNGLPPPGALSLPPSAHPPSLFRGGDMRYPHGSNDWPSRDNRMDYSPEYRRSTGGNPGSGTGNSGDYDRRPQT